MYYTIYKTTNLINGKFYIGKHQTNNLNDGYLGSGKFILSAIKKHGRGSFKKEILYVFDSEEEMNSMEKFILTEEFVSNSNNYNAGVGGEGGPHFKGKHHSASTRKEISAKAKSRGVSNTSVKALIDSTHKRIASGTHNFCSLGLKRKTVAPFKGRKHSIESIKKRTESRRCNKLQRQEALETVS